MSVTSKSFVITIQLFTGDAAAKIYSNFQFETGWGQFIFQLFYQLITAISFQLHVCQLMTARLCQFHVCYLMTTNSCQSHARQLITTRFCHSRLSVGHYKFWIIAKLMVCNSYRANPRSYLKQRWKINVNSEPTNNHTASHNLPDI